MTVANIIEGYWKAVAKEIDAADEKVTLLGTPLCPVGEGASCPDAAPTCASPAARSRPVAPSLPPW
jgi:hypothetical protein